MSIFISISYTVYNMDILHQIVSALSKEELRYFKIYAKRMADTEDRKDFLLLDYIRKKGEEYSDKDAAKKIYQGKDKASFYRLKNRLQDYLCDYLALHHTWKGDWNELSRHLSLYDIFLRKKQYKVALFYLKKAERKALNAENYEMLDVVYGNYVKLSEELFEINPVNYIQQRRENAERLNKIRETDQALAALNYRLKLTQNVSGAKTDALKILDNTLREFTSDNKLKKSKHFQTRIYRAMSQTLLQQHKYADLENFLKETYDTFTKEKWFDKDNHDTKLQMLTYLVNAHFRTAKYTDSLQYAEQLGVEISAFNKSFYDKYLFFYYNSLIINYSALDKPKALNILEQFERETRNKQNSYYDQFLHFNKAMLLHQLNKPDAAVRSIVKLYVNDNFKKADASFKLKIAMAELIMQFDSGDMQGYSLRSDVVKKQYKTLLTEGDFKRDRELLQLIDRMATNLSYKRDVKLRKKIEGFITAKVPATAIDSEIIKYTLWLSNKWGLTA